MAQLFSSLLLSTENSPTPPPFLPREKNSPSRTTAGSKHWTFPVELTEIWTVLASAETWVRVPSVTPHVCPRDSSVDALQFWC